MRATTDAKGELILKLEPDDWIDLWQVLVGLYDALEHIGEGESVEVQFPVEWDAN